MPSGVGWRFAGLTGDYNGIHYCSTYARLFGFRGALHHPQLVLGQCMSHLLSLNRPQAQRLDAWLKGPVYYDSDVRLCGTAEGDDAAFALFAGAEARPSVLGRWRPVAAGSRLLDDQDRPVPEGGRRDPAHAGGGLAVPKPGGYRR
jgi:hypothetical protein